MKNLKRELIKLLAFPNIKFIFEEVIRKLAEDNEEFAKIYSNRQSENEVLDYLASDQSNYDRVDLIVDLLVVSEQHKNEDRGFCEQEESLLAYFLHFLIKQPEVGDGIIKLDVMRRPTVQLIDAQKKRYPHIPNYHDEDLEFKNCRRNKSLEDIGDFQAPTGIFDQDEICRELAQQLLQRINDPDKNPIDPIKTLNGRININKNYPERSPLNGIQIKEEALKDHPFNSPVLVNRFIELTHNNLSIYIYGVKKAERSCLHNDEEAIRGALINLYHNENKLQTSSQAREPHSGNQHNHFYGPVINSSIVNHQSLDNKITEIAGLLNKAESVASHKRNANQISEQQFNELLEALNQCKKEIQKENPSTENLAICKKALDGFAFCINLAAAINALISLL